MTTTNDTLEFEALESCLADDGFSAVEIQIIMKRVFNGENIDDIMNEYF